MVVDANLLLYARDVDSPHHQPAVSWLTAQLRGTTRADTDFARFDEVRWVNPLAG